MKIMFISLFLALVILSGYATAHEQTPTYPKLERTYLPSILSTKVTIFNRRSDVSFFVFDVFDSEWNSIRFATTSRVLNIPHLKRETAELFINVKHKDVVTYICTTSLLQKDDTQGSAVSSRICSKVIND